MKELLKYIVLFLIGGAIYCIIEILWRGHTHWSMLIVGGIAFLLCGELNEIFPWEMPIQLQMLVCCINITALEFASGLVLNLWYGLDVWDYSNMPMNVLGQICVPFMGLWYFISFVAIVLDDYLRYYLFDEEEPRYKWR